MLRLIFREETEFRYTGDEDLAEKVENLASLNDCSLETDAVVAAVKELKFPSSITSVQIDIKGHEAFEMVVNGPVPHAA